MPKVTYKLPNVLEKRTELAWTQIQLASTAKVAEITIKNIERGSAMSLITAKKLARALDCSWEELTQAPLLAGPTPASGGVATPPAAGAPTTTGEGQKAADGRKPSTPSATEASVAPAPAMVDNPASKAEEGDRMTATQTVAEFKAELELTKVKEENQGLKDQLTTANSHQRLGTVLAHAREACPDCRQDLDQHNQRIIKSAFEGLEPAAARELAMAKGLLPHTLNFRV